MQYALILLQQTKYQLTLLLPQTYYVTNLKLFSSCFKIFLQYTFGENIVGEY